MDCIDLQARFGRRYRVDYEAAYFAERTRKTIAAPWLMTLLCRNGHICPWGGEHLAACTVRRGSIAKRLAELDCTTIVQSGDDGINATFHINDFETVAEVMKPRRRRTMSPEQRTKSAERLSAYQFQPARHAKNSGLESDATSRLVSAHTSQAGKRF